MPRRQTSPPPRNGDAWTLAALKQYVDTLKQSVDDELVYFREMTAAAWDAHKEIHASELENQRRIAWEMDKRYDEVQLEETQFRERIAETIPRELYDRRHAELVSRIEALEKWRATIAGRTAVIVFLVAVAASLIGLVVGHLLYG